MIDFSHIRTIDQIEAERCRLEQEVTQDKMRIRRDIQSVQTSWSQRFNITQGIFRIAKCFMPKPSYKTILSILSSALVTRLIFRRKA